MTELDRANAAIERMSRLLFETATLLRCANLELLETKSVLDDTVELLSRRKPRLPREHEIAEAAIARAMMRGIE